MKLLLDSLQSDVPLPQNVLTRLRGLSTFAVVTPSAFGESNIKRNDRNGAEECGRLSALKYFCTPWVVFVQCSA